MNPDIEYIRKSGLFDEDFYIKENPDIEQHGIDPITHYVLHGHLENRNPTVFFSTKVYKKLFDIGNENPFIHYLKNNLGKTYIEKGYMKGFTYETIDLVKSRLLKLPYYSEKEFIRMNMDLKKTSQNITEYALTRGLAEGREIVSKILISEFLGTHNTADYKLNLDKETIDKSVGVFCHSKGNIFIKELAEILNSYLINAGINSKIYFETDEDMPDLCIFVAPHEFFYLDGTNHLLKDEILTKSIMFNTEQPQTLWFTRGLVYLLMSAGIIDISYQNTEAFNLAGIPSFHFDPIPEVKNNVLTEEEKKHSLARCIHPNTTSNVRKTIDQRPYDVSFFGNFSPKRDKFFSRSAKIFCNKDCFLYYRKTNGIIPSSVFTSVPKYVSENSKIFLNVHRDESNFFEWHRIVLQGMACGSVVVTDECLEHPIYKNNIHYMTESVRHIPDLIEWLLNTVEGKCKLNEIQKNCFDVFDDFYFKESKLNDITKYLGGFS